MKKINYILVSLTLIIAVTIFFISKYYITNQINNDIQYEIVTTSNKKTTHFYRFVFKQSAKLKAIDQNHYFKKFTKDNTHIDYVKQLFLSISKSFENIYQLRYLNSAGDEIIKVEKTYNDISTITPKHKLQNKVNRYYFHNISKLPPDTIWYSHIDLNIENGRIEHPYRPTLRIGSKVDVDGIDHGVLIINILVKEILKDTIRHQYFNIDIVDKDGYYLYSHNNKYSWSRYLKTEYNIFDKITPFTQDELQKDRFEKDGIYFQSLYLENGEHLLLAISPKKDLISNRISKELTPIGVKIFLVTIFIFIIGYIVTMIKNNKQQKIIQSELNKSIEFQQQLLSLFEFGDTILIKWIDNPEYSIEYLSVGIEKFLGYKRGDFISGQIRYIDCIHPDDKDNVLKSIEQSKQQDINYIKHNAYRLITRTGDIKWVLDNTLIVKNDNNNVINYIGFINDITEQKTKDNLITEQSKLAAMGEMIGNIAHQWRQPLSIISTAASGTLLQKQLGVLDDEEFTNTCKIIEQNVQYLSNTIDDFRNFIKGNSIKEAYNLDEIIESFLHLVSSTIESAHIDLIKNIPNNIHIITNKNELIQCFINIINNSKDILIEQNNMKNLVFIDVEKSEKYTKIIFKDNGGGIPEEILPKVFEPYFTTKHQSQGTGIGLNMTYLLITESLQGNIYVENKTFTYEGVNYKGAQFTIELPNITFDQI